MYCLKKGVIAGKHCKLLFLLLAPACAKNKLFPVSRTAFQNTRGGS